ncbi:MAG TPA: hypothetical protein DCE44_05050, partial [Verrucomicrobiales bacterium]|nr:hypothetical protein [Verrucomicrobiales bacterium]
MPCSSGSFRCSCGVCGSFFAISRLKEQVAADIPPNLDTLRTPIWVVKAVPVKWSAQYELFPNEIPLMNHRSTSRLRMIRPIRVGILLVAFALTASWPRAVAETNAAPTIGLKLITEGTGAPMALVPTPDGSGRMLLAEQSGVIHLLDRDGNRAESLFLDLRPNLVAINQGMEERGLLGLALHPQSRSNGKFYVVYSAPLRTNAPQKWDHAERLRKVHSGARGQIRLRRLVTQHGHRGRHAPHCHHSFGQFRGRALDCRAARCEEFPGRTNQVVHLGA